MNTRKRFTFLIVMMIGTLVALTACGDSEPAAQPTAVVESAVQPTPGADSIIAAASTATLETAGPPTVAVVPAEVPEVGSVQEKLLMALEKQVRAINTQDWEGYLDVCSPAQKKITADKVRYMFEEIGGEFGFDIPSFSMEGYNARNVVFTVYSAKNARTEFDIYDHDTWITSGVSRTWEQVDGEWYSDAFTCSRAS